MGAGIQELFLYTCALFVYKEKEMLSQICLYLKNWFNAGQDKFFGDFTIESGQLTIASSIPANQYYRITGSVFNDGVYKRGSEALIDESFKGGIWLMAVPKDVIDLAEEIEAWQTKYGRIDSENMSPYQSESFGGYSYSKSSGNASVSTGSSVPTWQSVFGARLRRYRKI